MADSNLYHFADMVMDLLYHYKKCYFKEPYKTKHQELIKLCVTDDLYKLIIKDRELTEEYSIIEGNIDIHNIKIVSSKNNVIKLRVDGLRKIKMLSKSIDQIKSYEAKIVHDLKIRKENNKYILFDLSGAREIPYFMK